MVPAAAAAAAVAVELANLSAACCNGQRAGSREDSSNPANQVRVDCYTGTRQG